jgi:phosphohistidine phosphatase
MNMKTLLILRHAKSSWDDSSQSDHDRPLNKRGNKDAPRIGELLRDEGLLPDRVLGSTALRVRETVELAAQHSGYRGKIEFVPELYLAQPETYLTLLRELPDDCASAMVVGHNPGLEDLLGDLTGEEQHLPTGALAKVELEIDQWRDLEADARGKLIHLWRPKELDES